VLVTSSYAQAVGNGFTASSYVTWRATGTLTKIDVTPASGQEVTRQYRFGDELLYGAALGWSPDLSWGFELGVRGRHAEPDQATTLNPDGTTTAGVQTLPSTGGEWLWFAPTLRYAALETGTVVTFGVQVPILENLRGSQLGSQLGLRFSVEVHP
jgi:hypothetical protein